MKNDIIISFAPLWNDLTTDHPLPDHIEWQVHHGLHSTSPFLSLPLEGCARHPRRNVLYYKMSENLITREEPQDCAGHSQMLI